MAFQANASVLAFLKIDVLRNRRFEKCLLSFLKQEAELPSRDLDDVTLGNPAISTGGGVSKTGATGDN
jgi:hypothetical protein